MMRDAMLATLQDRLLAGMMGMVANVLADLDDDDLRALIKATDGEDPVAQARAERFIFRKAAETAMKRASAAAVARAAVKRDAAKADADRRDDAVPAEPQPSSAPSDAPGERGEIKWA